MDESRRSKLIADTSRILQHDMDAIELLKTIASYGSRYCDQMESDNRGLHNEDRDVRSDSGWAHVSRLAFIVAARNEAREAAKNLKDWLRKSQHVIMCDPYILHFSVRRGRRLGLFKSIDEYIDFVSDLIPSSARCVKLFGNGYTSKIKKSLRLKLKHGRQLEIFDTEAIHDRYIIKDNAEGRMIGTSFGGFGSKVFTILPLPRQDTEKLLGLLYRIQEGENLMSESLPSTSV